MYKCITDDAKDIDIVMPGITCLNIVIIIQKVSRSLCQYCKDNPNDIITQSLNLNHLHTK